MTLRLPPLLFTLLVAACSAQAPSSGSGTVAPTASGRSTALARPRDLPEAVRQLTARGPETRLIAPGTRPGSKVVRILDGNAEVMIARSNPDGTVSTRCVDSGEGAQAFLDETPAAGDIVRAAQ